MGRLRDGYESPYMLDVTEEVVDLFGNDDVILYHYYQSDNCNTQDPVWNEPIEGQIVYRDYKIKCLFQDYTDEFQTSNIGSSLTVTTNIYIALNHLINAGVTPDTGGDYVNEGDIIELFHKGRRTYFDIIQIDRDGFVNDTDIFTGYRLDAKRITKYEAERKIILKSEVT